MARLILVGAGPGDEDHMTVKGIKALQMADVIFYDDFDHQVLLEYCSINCIKIYVGKYMEHNAVHKMIFTYAVKHETTIRLTAGDPYILGTGHEEQEYALKHGLKVEIIPGVSNILAIPKSMYSKNKFTGVYYNWSSSS